MVSEFEHEGVVVDSSERPIVLVRYPAVFDATAYRHLFEHYAKLAESGVVVRYRGVVHEVEDVVRVDLANVVQGARDSADSVHGPRIDPIVAHARCRAHERAHVVQMSVSDPHARLRVFKIRRVVVYLDADRRAFGHAARRERRTR